MQDNLEILSRAIEQWANKDRPVSNAPSALELKELIDVELSDNGCDSSDLEQAIHDYLEFSPDVSRPEFFKLLYSGMNKPALLGDWVTSLTNATMHTYQVGPVATLMELELIRQWNKLVGFDEFGGEGVMVAGGSQANMIGMMLARHRVMPESKTRGLEGKTLVAYVSDQAHYSNQRSANLLGIGTNNLVAVESDEQGRMCPEALEKSIQQSVSLGHTPFYIGATAGTTVLGAYDPIEACSEIAKKYDIWLHIDGAWGAPVLFSEQHRHLINGSHLADSFAWDAHKLMNVPITAAVILVKHAGALKACTAGGGGEYLFHQDANAEYNLGERSIQCGRRADALKVWLSWKAVGHQGFAQKIDYLQRMKVLCVAMIEQKDRLEMLAPAAYLNILFRYKPKKVMSDEAVSQLNIAICKAMKDGGGAYVDYANYKGTFGIRLILANEQVGETHLDALLAECQQYGSELESINN
ncbi:MAG: pyridoxal phosphate-dependent decarboxylase family protein [Arenicella sp.]